VFDRPEEEKEEGEMFDRTPWRYCTTRERDMCETLAVLNLYARNWDADKVFSRYLLQLSRAAQSSQ
jgi:hypothetical protein